ncbi:SPOR domain-containing protein [Leucobacter sp. CSA2]|uniref:SPOR domain-containing protein n=1 Tax=Leucobacter edaphi TaxID=2796472 RepID=A0A934QF99_9MICO|nr:SPOR domain-containing protein [Leucobacter edaphi]MBK0422724.1 SPOR domain-containing protein [Leucobacter edaphi]
MDIQEFEAGQDEPQKYFYNLKTGEVAQGYAWPAVDRVGPFDTEEEANHALEKIRENSEKWAAEDALDD